MSNANYLIMRYFFSLFFCFQSAFLLAQIQDNFNRINLDDGDVIWHRGSSSGVTGDFVIMMSELQAQFDKGSGTRQCWISTAIADPAQAYVFKWTFKVKLDFGSLSSSLSRRNKTRIYLISEESDLNLTANGLFLEAKPVANEDSLTFQLYHLKNGDEILLESEKISKAATFEFAHVMVKKDQANNWEVWVNEKSQGKITYTASQVNGFFGAQIFFSSGAREDKFFFDDFSLIKYPYLDSLVVLNEQSIQLTFSAKVDSLLALEKDNYLLNDVILPSSVQVQEKKVILQFDVGFTTDLEQNLKILEVADTSGNALPIDQPIQTTFIYSAPDLAPPQILNVKGIQDSVIIIQFDEALQESSLISNKLWLKGSGKNPLHITRDSAHSYLLHFDTTFEINQIYELSATNISDLEGNLFSDTLNQSFVFKDRWPPSVANFSFANSNTLSVAFDEVMNAASISNPDNYKITADIHPVNIIHESAQSVKLFFAENFVENETLTLEISNLQDLYQNTMLSAWSDAFVYDTEKPSIPSRNAVYPISDSVVKVMFTEAVDTLTAQIVNNYRLRNDLGDSYPKTIEVDTANSSIVYLYFDKSLASEQEYSLRVTDVADLAGNTMNTRTRKFYYDVRAPFAESVKAFPNNRLLIAFNEPPNLKIQQDTVHFSASGVHPTQILPFYESTRKYWLFFDTLVSSDSLLFTLENIADFQGNVMLSIDTFYLDNLRPQIANLQALSKNSILLEFSMEVDTSWQLGPSAFQIDHTYLPDSICVTGHKAALYFKHEWQLDRTYHLKIDSLRGRNGHFSLNLQESFKYVENISAAYIKDAYQIVLRYQQPLLRDSLSNTHFLLNGNKTPLSVFTDEIGGQITLLFQEKLLADSVYNLEVQPQLQFNGTISPAQNFSLKLDKTPPVLEKAYFSDFNEITLYFDESLLEQTAEAYNHYQLNFGGQSIMPSSINLISGSKIVLQFDVAFGPGQSYLLSVSRLKDLSGNILTLSSQELSFPQVPKKGAVIISEIMADPTPQQLLPKAEYIELHNTMDKPLSLLHLYLEDESRKVLLGNGEIPARGFLILCDDAFGESFSEFGETIGLAAFPSITNSGETIKLWNSAGELLDAVNYTDDWHEASKKDGGWSLERIQAQYACTEKDNWRSSTSNLGGTPGALNSVTGQIPDTFLPLIQSHQLIGGQVIQLSFSEKMDTLSVDSGNQFVLNDSINPRAIEWIGKDTLDLAFNEVLAKGRLHELIVKDLRDCFGNLMLTDTLTIAQGKFPELHEIRITEIMADPEPSAGLPEVEYLEIYNATDQLLDLNACTLSDATSTTQLSGYILPKSYRVLCTSSNAHHFGESALPVSGFPSLNNTGEPLVIKNQQGSLVYFVHYSDDWYRQEEKATGGFSLEMLDVYFPCGGEENWIASASLQGGTPGVENSVKDTLTDNFPPYLTKVYAIDSTHLVLVFNENVDSLSLQNATYQISPSLELAYIEIESGYFFDRVHLYFSSALENGKVYSISVKNIQDCAGNTAAEFSNQSLVLPETASENDILLSEVLFNPPPSGVDFVEIYNASDKYINLQNWKVANGKGDEQSISDEVFIIPPHRFLVLMPDRQAFKSFYPTVPDSLLQEVNLPSFNDDEGKVKILNFLDEFVQDFHYDENMHNPLLEDKEGVSLERIDYKISEKERDNWHSAAQSEGFATPAKTNSQNSETTFSDDDCFKVTPAIITPDLDGQDDFAQIQYGCLQNGTMASVTIYDVKGRIVRKLIQNQSLANQGFFTWDGTKDNGEKVGIGYYTILIETFNLNGRVKPKKLSLAVGSRF